MSVHPDASEAYAVTLRWLVKVVNVVNVFLPPESKEGDVIHY